MNDSNENETETDDETLDEGWDDGDDGDDAGDDPVAEGAEATGAAPVNGEANAGENREPARGRRRKRSPDDDGPYTGDDRSQAALAFVMDVLDKMEMDCDVELRRPKAEEPNEVQLEIYGRDAGRIIGKKGQVLSALQYLTNRVVNRPGLDKRYVTVDAEGYRSRRDDTLATMARQLGKQAITEGKIITFEPMNPRDRRVIHLALAKFDGVVTKSEGEGEDRRVQIIPVRR
jgi:spoIIIJ-associated protein